eukprot:679626-Pyramimonas_sp.AAC.1
MGRRPERAQRHMSTSPSRLKRARSLARSPARPREACAGRKITEKHAPNPSTDVTRDIRSRRHEKQRCETGSSPYPAVSLPACPPIPLH